MSDTKPLCDTPVFGADIIAAMLTAAQRARTSNASNLVRYVLTFEDLERYEAAISSGETDMDLPADWTERYHAPPVPPVAEQRADAEAHCGFFMAVPIRCGDGPSRLEWR